MAKNAMCLYRCQSGVKSRIELYCALIYTKTQKLTLSINIMRGGAVGIEEFMAWLDDLEDLVKAPDWKKITLVTIIPVIVVFVLGGVFFSKKVTVIQAYITDEVGKLFSTQDLPTQIGNIDNNELKVVQGQLADVQVEQEKDKNGEDTNFALNFTKLNADTDPNNFFKTLIGIRYDTNKSFKEDFSHHKTGE